MGLFRTTIKYFGFVLSYLFFKRFDAVKSGAEFAKNGDLKKYLSSSNTGLLVDGQSRRLSLDESFKGALVIAKTGKGKTTKYVIPNVIDKANIDCSMIINDPSSEIYNATSGYLKSKGFDIQVFDPRNSRTLRMSPLAFLEDFVDVDTLSEILVSSGLPSEQNIWSSAAKRIISIVLRCMLNAPKEYQTLGNLQRLTNYISSDIEVRDPLTRFVAMYCRSNPSDDDSLKMEYKAFWNQNDEGINSISLTVQTALRNFSNPMIRDLFGKNEIDFSMLRNKKIALFIITSAEKAKQFSFVTSIFFNSFVSSIMRQEPFQEKKHLPIFFLYDELGHSRIPEFGTTLNLVRKYGVSVSGILQSISQLQANYKYEHNVIREAFNHYIVFSGADKETCDYMSSLAGFVKLKQLKKSNLGVGYYHEEKHHKLINPDEIRALPPEKALCIFGDCQPAIIDTKPYFKTTKYRRITENHEVYMLPKKEKHTDYNVNKLILSGY